ncbi:MAG TPA: IPT/TIG domain-containing protein [Acidobacteriota bacterium]|nr:IPT/TIG domain-containing protein [Acidobacteriota bacterium]
MRLRTPKIKNVQPQFGIEGGKILIEGSAFDPEEAGSTQVLFGETPGRILLISNSRILAQIPEEVFEGSLRVQIKNKTSEPFDFQLGKRLSSDVNPVDNPVFDSEGNLYVAFSGKRGETAPVSVYKIGRDGELKPHLSNIPNATSMVFDNAGNLYVSSRFEGTVYKATPQADITLFAKDLGTPTGLAFDKEGFLYVGDRAGRILKVASDGTSTVFAEVPESTVAFHLAFDPEGNLLVTNPGLSSYNQILMVDRYGKVIPLHGGFGRPQGLAVDAEGNIYVSEAKAGDSSILKISKSGDMTSFVAGPVMVGLAFYKNRDLAVASPNAIYKLKLSSNGG